MRRLLSALSLLAFFAAFAPLAYKHVVAPSAVLVDGGVVQHACTQAEGVLRARSKMSAGSSSLLSMFSRRLLPMRPRGIHFAFYLANMNPVRQLVTWDFAGDVLPSLSHTLDTMGRFTDVSVSSRVLLYGKFGSKPVATTKVIDNDDGTGREVFALKPDALRKLLAANDWDLGAAEDAAGRVVLRFLVILPDPDSKYAPLYVKDGEGALKSGFLQSRWGGVTILNPRHISPANASGTLTLPAADAHVAVHTILSQMHAFLGLTDAGNTQLTPKQVSGLGLEWMAAHLKATCDALSQTLALADRVTYMTVPAEVVTALHAAVDGVHNFTARANDARTSNDDRQLFNAIWNARTHAELAANHHEMMPQMYLPPEHIAALLLPFWAPFVLPLAIGVISGMQRWAHKRKQPQHLRDGKDAVASDSHAPDAANAEAPAAQQPET